MQATKKIEIRISKEKYELLKKSGLSPQEIFSKGFESFLRQKYKELSMVDDDCDEDEIEWMEVGEVTKEVHEINEFFVNENDIANN